MPEKQQVKRSHAMKAHSPPKRARAESSVELEGAATAQSRG